MSTSPTCLRPSMISCPLSLPRSCHPRVCVAQVVGSPTLSDLLSALHQQFTNIFMPLVRQFLGTQHPWYDISVPEFDILYRKAFGPLATAFPFAEGSTCYHLVSTRPQTLSILIPRLDRSTNALMTGTASML